MTLEDQLVEALSASDNERVVELLKAGADPNHKCWHPAKPSIPNTVHVLKVAFDCKNYHGCLHLLDYGAYDSMAEREFFRESIRRLATNYYEQ